MSDNHPLTRKRYSYVDRDDIPSSTTKRGRLSLLPTNVSIGHPRLANQPSHRRRPSLGFSQQSHLPRLAIQQAEPPTHSRIPTQANQQQQQQLHDTPLNTGNRANPSPYGTRTPRTMVDRSLQIQMQNELFDYLSTHKFDIDMKHQLTPKTLKSPTQKDFVLIFEWLYKQLDPGYRFIKSVEHDVYFLLKVLAYPDLQKINKSQISAVGGAHWPNFLSMLHWLMGLVTAALEMDNIELSRFQEDQQPAQNTSMFADQAINDSLIIEEQNLVSKMFTRYALKSYKEYMFKGAETFEEQFEEMEKEYEVYVKEVERKTSEMSSENRSMLDTINRMMSKNDELNKAIERNRSLQRDLGKFKKYVDLQYERSTQWPIALQKLQVSISLFKESIVQAEEEKRKIVAELNSKNLTLKELEQMHQERTQLSSHLNNVSQKQREVEQSYDEKFQNLKGVFVDLDNMVQEYNTWIYKSMLSADLTEAPQLTITNFNDDLINNESKLGLKPHELLPQLKQLNVKSELLKLKETIIKKHAENLDKLLVHQGKVDDLHLEMMSLKDEVESLEEKLTKSRKDYSAMLEHYNNELSSKQLQSEERSKEIRMQTLKMDERRKQTTINYENAQKQRKKAVTQLDERQQNLFYKLNDSMAYVATYKTEIMNDLETMNESLDEELSEQVLSMDLNKVSRQ
ncbi:unnamed protein product [Ambrosiozyma monospora]|uniref:Kinetochore protein NDC80 n=1 Tax=Ambrosiozyma monospora TaxID=43982 RepID=A0A9W6YU09_AMBMO|nr:unnamed protein product [Ambrosiozyma monospora]